MQIDSNDYNSSISFFDNGMDEGDLAVLINNIEDDNNIDLQGFLDSCDIYTTTPDELFEEVQILTGG